MDKRWRLLSRFTWPSLVSFFLVIFALAHCLLSVRRFGRDDFGSIAPIQCDNRGNKLEQHGHIEPQNAPPPLPSQVNRVCADSRGQPEVN